MRIRPRNFSEISSVGIDTNAAAPDVNDNLNHSSEVFGDPGYTENSHPAASEKVGAGRTGIVLP